MLPLLLALAADLPSFGPEERQKLEAGEVLVKRLDPTDGKGVAAKAAGLIRAPVDKVWSVIDDCDHYEEFMPRMINAWSIDNGDGCHTEVSMPFPLSNLWSDNRVVRTDLDGGGKRRAWTLLRGTYRRVAGSWSVFPYAGKPGTSLVVYHIDVDANVSLPDAILRAAQEGTLPDLFAAVRKRAGAKP